MLLAFSRLQRIPLLRNSFNCPLHRAMKTSSGFRFSGKLMAAPKRQTRSAIFQRNEISSGNNATRKQSFPPFVVSSSPLLFSAALTSYSSSVQVSNPKNNKPFDFEIARTAGIEKVRSWILKLIQFFHSLLYAIRVLWRFVRLCMILSITFLLVSLLYFLEMETELWYVLLSSIERCGPTFVKLAQWASTRPDLFGEYLCKNTSSLLDRTTPHSWDETENLLSISFGDNWSERLRIEKDHPIGSGSIAQVYKGSYEKEDGEMIEVAVKVMHPHVKECIDMDLCLMKVITRLVDYFPFLYWFSLSEMVNEFTNLMNMQTDLRIEAENLRKLGENFANSSYAYFPKPIYPWVSEFVLVEEYVRGEVLSSYLSEKTETISKKRKELAKCGLNLFLKMVFQDNFVHGDLHPGNIIVPIDGVPGLVLVDAGITTSLTKNDRRNFLDLFTAIVKNEGKTAGRLLVERASYHECSDIEGFSTAIANLIQKANSSGLRLGKVHIGSLITELLGLCLVHKVKLDSQFVSILIAANILEGVGRSLDPDINILKVALPYVLRS